MTLPEDIAKSLAEFSKELESRLNSVREELSGKLAEARAALAEHLEAAVATSGAAETGPTPGTAPTDLLNASIASVNDAGSQAEILRAMLEGTAPFARRTALFVSRGGALVLWQSRGFSNESALKALSLDVSHGLAARAMQDRTPSAAAASEFSQELVKSNGNPVDGNAWALPLIVRDKVAAIVYADAGITDPLLDASALQVLVRATSSWLEIQGLRKTNPDAPGVEISAPAAVSTRNESVPVTHAQEAPPEPPPQSKQPPAVSPGGEIAVGLSAQDQEVHKKAKRFAKLLVDEIKLYNQQKVADGRAAKDVYGTLKEDIDKSRSTYEKRYGSTAAAAAKYFDSELVRILAEGDVSLMGPGFPQ